MQIFSDFTFPQDFHTMVMNAEVAKLADALGSGPSEGNLLLVRVPPSVFIYVSGIECTFPKPFLCVRWPTFVLA